MSAAPEGDGAARTFFVLTLDGDVRLEVDATRGGRVTALRLGERNLLSGAEVDAVNYGSTFWTSPQSAWGWPPDVEIDSAPYAGALDGEAVVLRGPASAALGVSVEKRLECRSGAPAPSRSRTASRATRPRPCASRRGRSRACSRTG